MSRYTNDSQICLSTLTRTKRAGGKIESVQSWKCYEPAGHHGLCHGMTPNSPRWEALQMAWMRRHNDIFEGRQMIEADTR